jgi:hypothetical protein
MLCKTYYTIYETVDVVVIGSGEKTDKAQSLRII